MFLSYLRHDPYEEAIEEAETELRQSQKELAKAAARREAVENEVAEARSRMAQLRAWATDELSKAKNRAREQRNFFEQLMQEYRMANQAARERPGEVIRALETWEKPTIPPDLREDVELDWQESSDDGTGPLPA